MGAEYDAFRRIGKVERLQRVEKNDKTEGLDLKRKAKFEAALLRTAEVLRKEEQHKRHHTYDDAQGRLAPAKKK